MVESLPPGDRAASATEPTVVGEHRTVVVAPEEVWSAPRPGPPPEPGPEPARHSFAAPILMVTGLSAALLTVLIALLALLLWLKR